MADAETTQTKFVPPYGAPWETTNNMFTKMRTDGLPQRVDRSYLSNQSGNVQTYLMQTLKSLGLCDEAGAPTPLLAKLVEASDEERKPIVADLLRRHFGPILDLGATNATQAQLEEEWTKLYGQTGSTRTKGVRWFLAACVFSGITVSKFWKAPKAPPTGTTRKPRSTAKKTPTTTTPATSTPTTPGDTYEVTLIGGGTIRLTVNESHFNLSKNRTDRDFVNGLVDGMTDYAASHDQEVVTGTADELIVTLDEPDSDDVT